MRKTISVFTLALFLALSLLAIAEEGDQDSLTRLSKMLKKGSAPNVILSKSEKVELEALLQIILPDEYHIGEEKEWVITYHDMEQGDFFEVDLKDKGDESFDRHMWFHILYKQENPSFYGSENFEGYRGMGMKDVHYFILVGNVEIRAVASSLEYKSDNKIKGILKAFRLEEIEGL